ncbi:MAG: DnaB-like helicase N-terminal domain-containing protein, partial [Acutalibacteraceae bacterium]
QVEGGKDPDEYIKEYGAERFRLLLEGAKNDIEFKLVSIKSGVDFNSDAGKLDYLNGAVEVLADVSDEIARNLYAGRISDETGVDKKTIISRVNNIRKAKERKKLKKTLMDYTAPKYKTETVNPKAGQYKRAAAAEETVLSIMMQYPQLLDYICENINEDDFLTDFNKDLFIKLKEILSKSTEFNESYLSDCYDAKQLGRVVKIRTKVINSKTEQVIDDCIKVIKDEKDKLGIVSSKDMTDEDFKNAMELLKKNKKG